MMQSAITINQGLDFILGHFLTRSGVNTPRSKELHIWPRTISTKASGNKQITVGSKEEALAYYVAANYEDCRISAYPPNVLKNPFRIQDYAGLYEVTPIDIQILIDYDRRSVKTERGFRMGLTQILGNIREKLGVSPSIIWSGNGYHILQPLNGNDIILEDVKEFADTTDVSRKFLQFAESYLSLNKSDPVHNSTVSFNNCMLRVPGSINSKNGETVRVIQKWDNKRPEINYMLLAFERYIINEKFQELLEKQRRRDRDRDKQQPWQTQQYNSNITPWIEKLLNTPLDDHRKYCIWHIIVPYLLNIRKLPEHEVIDIMMDWLQKCNQLRRLDFRPQYKIREGIRGAKKGIKNIAADNLKNDNPELYEIIAREF